MSGQEALSSVLSAADDTAEFLELSALLTGFSGFQLLGTGMAGHYLRVIDAVLPDGVLTGLLDAFRNLPAGPDREAALGPAILADPMLGPVARNIILMWYCGTWADDVVSAEAYQAGLQWIAAGAHPAGAGQQGYGAWAVAPERTRA